MKKKLAGVLIMLLALPSLALAQEALEGWIGTWTVTLQDETVVTWEITETAATSSGAFRFAYGTVNPGVDDVTFIIMSARFFPGQHYFEGEHTTDTGPLPSGLDGYTKLVPNADYTAFTAEEGPFPIRSGVKAGAEPEPEPEPDPEPEPEPEPDPEPEPEPCAATYLLGDDDPRLNVLRQFRDERLALSAAGCAVIELYYDRSADIIDICERCPMAKKAFTRALVFIIAAVNSSL